LASGVLGLVSVVGDAQAAAGSGGQAHLALIELNLLEGSSVFVVIDGHPFKTFNYYLNLFVLIRLRRAVLNINSD
jgi:hypothetical protein